MAKYISSVSIKEDKDLNNIAILIAFTSTFLFKALGSKNHYLGKSTLIMIGLVAGLIIAAVDNFAFGGEVSPIVIVLLLIIVTVTSGIKLGWRAWILAFPLWICIPLAHLIKHILGLPDTLHPNTYASILMLAAFTFVVSTVGLLGGVLMRKLIKI